MAKSEFMTPHQSLAANGKSFDWARRFLGKQMGGDAATLYRFCRVLDDLADAFHAGLPEGALILAPAIRDMLGDHIAGLRKTVAAGVSLGVPMPALSASLAWYDSIRTARGSANLIQAQRDFFGAHGFERGDIAGAHHGTWNAIRRD